MARAPAAAVALLLAVALSLQGCGKSAEEEVLSEDDGSAPADNESSPSGGNCLLSDFQAIGEAGAANVSAASSACLLGSLGWTGVKMPTLTACLQLRLGLSAPCAGCYADAGDFAYRRCSGICAASACSSACLSCASDDGGAFENCTGRARAAPEPCDAGANETGPNATLPEPTAPNATAPSTPEAEVPGENASSCLASDFEALGAAGLANVSAVSGECLWQAYTFWGHYRKHKMTGCLEERLNLSAPCAVCYADDGHSAYRRCQRSCAASACSSACLACVADDGGAFENCTGHPRAAPEPCDGEAPNATAPGANASGP